MKKGIAFASLFAVFALFFCACGAQQGAQLSAAATDAILMVNETLYYGTDEVGPMGDAGCVAGRISSAVNLGEIPSQNGESNFGCIGNPYTSDFGDGMIMVLMEDEAYHVFHTQNPS